MTIASPRPLFFPLLLLFVAMCVALPIKRWGVNGRLHGWLDNRLGFHRDLPDLALALYPGQTPVPYNRYSEDGPASLYCYFADENMASHTGLLVCVGGGYSSLSMNKEGQECIRHLRALGLHIFILRYTVNPKVQQRPRSPNGVFPQPINEVIRAMRLLRANADYFEIDSDRIGVAGFSAGGHVASTLGTHYDFGNPYADDFVDRVSSRPDFMLLAYPVITMRLKTGSDSRGNLLGKNPPEYLVDFLSNDEHVTPDTPQTFIIHADDDSMVSSQHSVLFHRALQRNNVPHQFLMLESGNHGVGMRFWLTELSEWLRRMNLVKQSTLDAHGRPISVEK